MALFNKLTVAGVRRETDDCVSIAFAVPARLADDYAFTPGQFLTLRARLQDRELRRCYSICSAPSDGELRVAIRRVEGGLFSGFANGEIRAGDSIDVMRPDGRFVLKPNAQRAGRYVCIAAGAGVTPVLSIIRAALLCEPQSTVTLIYGNRSAASVIFRERLADLKDRFPTRLSLFHVLSRERQDTPLLNGRIDAEKLAQMLDGGLIDAAATDRFFLCGPEAMIETATEVLGARGVARERIRFELFTPAEDGNRAATGKDTGKNTGKAGKKAGAELPKRHIVVIVDGHRRSFDMADDGARLLDAALAQQLDLPYACKGGMCCTCRARLKEGAVEMDKTYGLEPEEIAAGYVLTCQAVPVTARVVLDFDDRG